MKILENKQYNVGIYTRLSKDDYSNTTKKYQPLEISASIANQSYILEEYVLKEGWSLAQIYQDDGYSGGNFERPAFLKMIEDAKKGHINLIIVKDLSRFGRDAVGVGDYTEDLFPSLGCRFISLSEGIDTLLDSEVFMPFYSMMNDYYLKNLSKTIKNTLHDRAKDGKCLFAYVPYGYLKSKEDKNKIVIDEYASEVIKRMFEMRLQNKGYAAIAKELNMNNILAPRVYWNKMYDKTDKEGSLNLWRDITVREILRNDIYTGRLTQMKTGTQSYKNKTMIKKDKSEWIIIENAHEPIISQKMWEEVQQIDLKKYDTRSAPQPSLFASKLHCSDCGKNLGGNTETHRRKNGDVKKYKLYRCQTYYQTGRSVCSSHTIYEIGLIQIVKDDLRSQAEKIKTDVKALRKELQERMCSEFKVIKEIDKEIYTSKKSLEELERKEMLYYEDKVSKKISKEIFQKLLSTLQENQAELSKRLSKAEKQKDTVEKKFANIDKWIKLVKKYAKLQTIDRTFIEELIEYIEVSERQVIDGVKHQDIKIVYKFVGQMDN